MPSRRSQITMSPEEIKAFLEGGRTMNIATNGVGGYPHVVAMWYCLLDGKPAFWTFGKAQKVMNLRRDPKITALVEAGETYDTLQGVELVGTARLVEDVDTVLAIGKAVALRYRGQASETPESLAVLEAQARKRMGVIIDVERVVSWDHTKLSGGY
jgi:PPOX class probable F420-dependent enzyme